MNRTITRLVLVVILLVSAFTALRAGGWRRGKDGGIPVSIQMVPAHPSPNQIVTITVSLSGSPSSDQWVTIGCTDPYAFTNLPTEVCVNSGNSEVSFTATTSPNYVSDPTLTATMNTVSVLSGM